MLDLGTLRVGIQADSDKATSSLKSFQSELEGTQKKAKYSSEQITEATNTVNDAFGKVVAATAAFATAATAAFALTVKSALSGYASYEQNIGGINKLFGTAGQSLEDYAASVGKSVDEVRGEYDTLNAAAAQVTSDAKNAWKDAGISANTYMEQVTSFSASLITSLGGDTTKAAAYAKTAMVDMADNANTFGTSIEDIQHAYQGFAKQNYTMLDNLKLGYGGTKEEMERLISDANAVKAANGEMADLSIDSFADVVEAIHTMQEEMSIAGTTQREALTTIEGSVNAAKAAWENWVTGLGDDAANMTELTANLVESIGTAAQNIVPRVQIIIAALIAEIPKLFSQIKAMLPAEIQNIISIVETILPAITGILTTITTIWAAIQIKQKIDEVIKVVQALWIVLSANPILAVVAVVAGLAAAFVTAYNTNENFRNSVNNLFNAITTTLQPAIDAVIVAFQNFATTLMTNLQPLLEQVITAFNNIGAIVIPLVQTAFEILAPIILTIVANFLNLYSTVAENVIPIITSMIELFNEFVEFVTPLIQDALNVIKSIFDTVFPYIQNLVSLVFNAIQTHISTVLGVIQNVINVILCAIKGDWEGVFNSLKNIASTIFNGISNVISNVITYIQNFIQGILNKIQAIWSSAWNTVSQFVSGVMENMKTGISNALADIVNFFTNLPGRITSALGNLGNLLVSAGKSIISGLLNGLKQKFEEVKSFVSGIGSWIAAHKGPKAYDLSLLVPNGGWIMQSLASGLQKSIPVVKDALDSVTNEIEGYDFGTASVEADFNAYQRVKGNSATNSTTNESAAGRTNIVVNNYSPKSLTEKESARQFRRTVRGLAFA